MEEHVRFSKNNKYFALITDDGKLRVWNTETSELKHEYVPNIKVSAPCTCLVWVVAQEFQAKKNKHNDADQDYIALGTKKGGVCLFSLATGKIEFSLKGKGHSGPVLDICYNDTNVVYTCGEDCKIVMWSLANGSQSGELNLNKERPTSLTISPDKSKIICASRQIRVWALKGLDLKQTFTGHKSSIQFLRVFDYDESEFLISGSNKDRFLSLWNLGAANQKNSIATFTLEDSPIFLDILLNDGILNLIVVCRNNTIYSFREKIDKVLVSTKPIKAKTHINFVSNTKDSTTKTIAPIPAIGCVLEDRKYLNVAYGNSSLLKFEKVTLETVQKTQVLIRDDPRKVHSKNGTSDNSLGQVKPIVNDNQVEYSMISAAKRPLKPNEIQIETRLENLSLSKSDASDKVTPSTSNVTQLLVQGLHSNDSTILREAFAVTDVQTIRSTLQKLPPQYLGALINELTSLMQMKIEHVEMSMCWMKILVETHSSQLMALGAGELLSRFGPCLGIIEHRVKNLQSLSRVQGRLELLINQMRTNQRDDVIERTNENLLVFQDDTDSGSEEIDGLNESGESSSSDEQWDEEEDDDEEEGEHHVNGVDEDDSMDEDVPEMNGMDEDSSS